MYAVCLQTPGQADPHITTYPSMSHALRTFERWDASMGRATMLWLQNPKGEVLCANRLYLVLVEGREPNV